MTFRLFDTKPWAEPLLVAFKLYISFILPPIISEILIKIQNKTVCK